MEILLMVTTEKQQVSGKTAKQVGHDKETCLANLLTESTGVLHKPDGTNRTKIDVFSETTKYSLKSPSGKNTQVHLTPTHTWCSFFGITGDLESWFYEFFGLPRSLRKGRKNTSQIPEHLNELALSWFNDNKIKIFDVIVRHGAYTQKDGSVQKGDSVDRVVWYDKKEDKIVCDISVEELTKLIESGRWVWSTQNKNFATTLWFLDENDNKLFHLQMKGSGNASQFNSMQFHIYRPEKLDKGDCHS
jgi:hypothetical protein